MHLPDLWTPLDPDKKKNKEAQPLWTTGDNFSVADRCRIRS